MLSLKSYTFSIQCLLGGLVPGDGDNGGKINLWNCAKIKQNKTEYLITKVRNEKMTPQKGMLTNSECKTFCIRHSNSKGIRPQRHNHQM